MPNWTRNKVELHGPADELAIIKALVASEDQPFDFNKLAPMPAILHRVISPVRAGPNGRPMLEPAGAAEFTRSADWVEANEAETAELRAIGEATNVSPLLASLNDCPGFVSWYEWASVHWGTKWNAGHFEGIEESSDTLIYRFDTAWDAPRPLFETFLRKVREVAPNVSTTITASHEDDGFRAVETIAASGDD